MDSLKGHLVLIQGEVAHKDNPIIPTEQTHLACISSKPDEFNIIDLYAVGHAQKEKDTLPFIHMIHLKGLKGKAAYIQGLFDDGTLVNVMCSSIFDKIKLSLGVNSKQQLRMENGSIVPSEAHWEGSLNLIYECLSLGRGWW